MNDTEKLLFDCGVIPVIKIEDAADAVPLAEALLKGGIFVAEVTFRTDAAAQAIEDISNHAKDVFVGAGTVLDVKTAIKAIAAGAKFIVSPGFNEPVIKYCLENNVPVFPGVSSPTEIEKGIAYGLKVLKFFPAEANGGLNALKSMSAPYNDIKFMPTGGIDIGNIAAYLSCDKVIACGGSWMVKEELIKEKKFEEITRLSKQAVSAVLGFQFAHTAVNTSSQTEAVGLAQLLDMTFATGYRETHVGAFAGDFIEIMANQNMGRNGHIGFNVNNVLRTINYFERNGYEMDYETLRGTKENPQFIYLKQDFGGFRIHIMG